MKCMVCSANFEIHESNKSNIPGHVLCPFCMCDTESSKTNIIDDISGINKKWGIDLQTCENIIDCDLDDILCDNMVITSQGEVITGNDEDDLKKNLLEHILEEGISLSDIEYIFVNGERRSLEIDIQFVKDSK